MPEVSSNGSDPVAIRLSASSLSRRAGRGFLKCLLDLPPAFIQVTAEPTKLVFDRTVFAPAWLDVVSPQRGTLLLHRDEVLAELAQNLFGIEELRAAVIVETLRALASFVDADVLVELLD